ncbi:subclass B3 metallo-beta-lactamase [Pedobacter frigiditerrae]|uniref:Subclass B3 metallo-beta-lactamase n=1 Tax=Pedobacter frigiditerrae TaxID=2530452 RepID=A0A4R0MTF7_9SPHI|nr:subclass B3 metallo-beta-lactamase [Pedobacter frigiditerrae]TCC90335.1 subclass B3 metallo-beta-lactamase [Pedobacter frigiditerrae]
MISTPLKHPIFTLVICLLISIFTFKTVAQTIAEPKDTPAEWSKPYAPFRIVGNLYHVGTYDLACYLIVTEKGNILINTGLANSEQLISNNIKALGFKLTDTKILLTTQAHYDHMGAMAALKKATRAKVLVNANDAQVMKDGGSSDYALGNGVKTYLPLKPDALLHDKAVIKLGSTKLVMLDHPGHTKGSCSYLLEVKDKTKTYKVLIANMPTIVTDKKFHEVDAYPNIEKDYARTLKAMKALSFDIWLASHASQFNLHQKHKPTDSYNPTAFMDKKGYDKALADLQLAFDKKIAVKSSN